jgi:polyisoprenoid-binding protein YceI
MPLLKKSLFLGAISFAMLAGCNNNPVENKPLATVNQAAKVADGAPTDATSWVFNEQGSSVGFVGAKLTGKHDGSFGKFTGKILVVGGDASKSSVRAEIETDSLTVEPANLMGHLKSPDFFDVARFPKAVFQSTQIVAGGANGAAYTVTGNLELHGVTKSISFPAAIQITGEQVSVKTEFGINRKDFGIVYPGKPDDLIKDEVLIRLNLVAKKG